MFTVHNQAYQAFQQSVRPLEKVEFSMPRSGAEKSWKDTAKTVALISLKIIIFPWALYEGISWATSRLIMGCSYPAQNPIVKLCMPHLRTEVVDQKRMKIAQEIRELAKAPVHKEIERFTKMATEARKIRKKTIAKLLELPASAPPQVREKLIQTLEQSRLKIDYANQMGKMLNTKLKAIRNPERYVIKQVIFTTNGVRTSGIMIGTNETINNGKWVLQAAGNNEPVENMASSCAVAYGAVGCNVLLVNNPGVGGSEGTATPESMGATQNTAIEFLKTKMGATHIVLAGYSLGGASIGQAILQRDFSKDEHLKFFVLRQATFSKLSEVTKRFVPSCLGSCASALVRRSSCEMDNVAASRKLRDCAIPEVTIQAADDDVIRQHSLQAAKRDEGIQDLFASPAPLEGVKHCDRIRMLNESFRQIGIWFAHPLAQ
jgi:alpha/beta superfamily hydrolase